MPFLPGAGYIVDQDPLVSTDPADQIVEIKARHAAAIAEATAYLLTTDLPPWEIVELDITSRKVRRAFYSEEFGFVYPEHPDGRMVLFVEIPVYDGEG